MSKSPALFIGSRYASMRSPNLLVSFISILTVIGLALGVGVLIAVLSVMNGFDRELQQRILALVPHMTVTTSRNVPLRDESGWADDLQSMLADSRVTGAAPYLQLQGMLLANGRSSGILLNGIEPGQEAATSIIEAFMVEGSLATLAADEYGIVIGSSLARDLGVIVGDSVNLVSTVVPISPLGEFTRQRRFEVTGIFTVGSRLDSNLAYVHITNAQRLYRLGDGIHGYRLQTSDLFSVFDIANTLRNNLSVDVTVSDWSRDYGGMYENIRVSKTLVGLLLSMLVGVAAFNVIVSLVMVVRDKHGAIAILRTMGTSLGTIRRIFLVQGFLIGLLGTLSGLVLGLVLTWSAAPLVDWIQDVSGMQLLSSDVYPVNYLPTQIRMDDIVLVCTLALLLSLLATLYPAARAARVRPAEILRFE
jgi:lipoprotein-releasing system permease protein